MSGSRGANFPTEQFLERLEAVCETGPGRWLARCPAHDDRIPSLSIREMDYRVLLHCFSRCSAADVVAAVGLELRDLFRPSLKAGTHSQGPLRSRIPAADALRAMDHEALVVAMIASDVHRHRECTDDTWERLALAVGRIGRARDLCAPRRVKR